MRKRKVRRQGENEGCSDTIWNGKKKVREQTEDKEEVPHKAEPLGAGDQEISGKEQGESSATQSKVGSSSKEMLKSQ